MVDSEIFDLVTRLQQIEQESDLLASQQQELQRQLQAAETARDRRRKKRADSTGLKAEKWRVEHPRAVATIVVVDDQVDDQHNGWPHFLQEARSAVPVQVGNCGDEIRRIQVDFR